MLYISWEPTKEAATEVENSEKQPSVTNTPAALATEKGQQASPESDKKISPFLAYIVV